jgi:putative membrane protein
MMGGWTMGWTGWMWIWPVLIVGGLLINGYVVLRLVQGRSPAGSASDASAARRILNERFARGEIDQDEYSRRRSLLG